ncbi:4-coumarate--CoA ligase 1 [Ixodes scapularis]
MCLGATVIIRERNLSLEEFVDVVRTYAVTLMSWTPLMMQGIIRQATASGTSIPSVKTIIITGDILSKTLAKEINIHFRPRTLANSYALTESFGMISTTPVGEVALGNTGFPVAGCKVKVVHLDSGEPLKAYERGEILAQGNNMMNGYYGKPEATNTAFTTDGWLRTGDLGYYDDTGRIYVVERLKQMIKVLDHHVTPAEIEELLLTHAAVAEVAVVGIPSQEHGETPVACVVLNESHRRNSQTVETELMQLLTDNTTVHKHRFTSIAFWDSLPKTDTGKILRRELKIILSNLQSKEK